MRWYSVFGDCGTSTSISVADAVEIERQGIPTVTVFTAFAAAARKQAAGRGMADLPLARIPHPMHTAQRSVVAERADAVIDALVTRLTGHGTGVAEEEMAERFDGANTIDDQEFLFARGWTDGLPVLIPTAEKVAAMVAASGRDAADRIGPIPPRWRTATIEKLAINAVLAGCRPECFPVVLAAIDALLDNDCQLYGIQTATNTTAPLVIVNGPIVRELDINARGNLYGQGARANATIGRGCNLCSAMSAATFRARPTGFAAEDSAVTVIGASAPQNIFTYGCETGQERSRSLHRGNARARPQQHHLSNRAAVCGQP
jgi:hypothetical protein